MTGKIYFSAKDARDFDLEAQQKLGIPSIILMENAGRGVAEESLKMISGRGSIAVVCGTGNNGGDGLVAARHLLGAGKKVKIYLFAEEGKLKADPLTNLTILRRLKAEIIFARSAADIKEVKRATLIIDAIFGIGLSTPVRSPLAGVIDYLNRSGRPILSVDIPSGLSTDTGEVLGAAIKAKKTVTFVAPKKGFYLCDGPRHCGKIVIRRIY